MKTSKASSLQDIVKSSRRDEFIGRDKPISFFFRNLGYPPDDNRRRFVIGISGPGGVGKTWLVRRLDKIAKACGIVTVYSDMNDEDVIAVMGRIAEQFKEQGHLLRSFSNKYELYRQHKAEIEIDPEAPQRIFVKHGPGVVSSFLQKLSSLSSTNPAISLLNQLTALGGDIVAYLTRKIRDKDEIELVLNPLKILTPLLLRDMHKVTIKSPVVFFFDAYERTAIFLEPWLHNLLEGRYGQVPSKVIFVIAGRDELDLYKWRLYERFVARIPLEVFTENESRVYLTHKGITDEQQINAILRLSGGLPSLLAMFATQSSSNVLKIDSPNSGVIKCFLEGIEKPEQRQIAIDAAVPRFLNRDILTVLVKEEIIPLFNWLKDASFVSESVAGWSYDRVVRSQILRYKRREAPRHWKTLHKHLAEYYETLHDELELDIQESHEHKNWQKYTLEALYHRLCQTPHQYLSDALDYFWSASSSLWRERGAEMIMSAGVDADASLVQQWGERLLNLVKADKEQDFQEKVEILTTMLEQADLEPQWRVEMHIRRGLAYRELELEEEALTEFSCAIDLQPDNTDALYYRASLYRDMKRYNEALDDLNQIIDFEPNAYGVIFERILTYLALRQCTKALKDIEYLIELDSGNYDCIVMRALIYQAMNRSEEALAELESVIQHDPDNSFAIFFRGLSYVRLGQDDKALVDLEHAMNLAPEDISIRLFYWKIYLDIVFQKGDIKKASLAFLNLADFILDIFVQLQEALDKLPFGVRQKILQKSISIELPAFDLGEVTITLKSYFPLVHRFAQTVKTMGKAYEYLSNGQLSQALPYLSYALELSQGFPFPALTMLLASLRGCIYLSKGQYDKALTDFDYAISLQPKFVWSISFRAETYRQMGRYDEALANLDQAIELEPNNLLCIHLHLTVLLQKDEVERALMACTWLYEHASEYVRQCLQLQEMSRFVPDKVEQQFLYHASSSIGLEVDQVQASSNHFDDLLKNDFKGAIRDFRMGIAARASTLYLKTGRIDEAITTCNKSIELDGIEPACWVNRGEIYRLTEQYTKALKDFDQALVLQPNEVTVLIARGRIYVRMRQYKEALADFDRAIKLDPKNGEAIANRGFVYLKMGRPIKAQADFARARTFQPKLAEAIANQGAFYHQWKCYAEALANYNLALAIQPALSWAIVNRGLLYSHVGEYEEALKDYNRAIKLNPDNAGIIENRGLVYSRMGRYKEALKDFDRVIELRGDREDALATAIVNQCAIYLQMERYEEALSILNQAIKFQPDHAEMIAKRGTAYKFMAQYDKALIDFDKALALQPDILEAFANRAGIHLQQGRYEQALTDLNHAVALQPGNAEILENREMVYYQMERYEEALKDIDRAIELRIDNDEDFTKIIANRGALYLQLKRYEEALSDLSYAVEKHPNDAGIVENRGIIYLQMERHKEALDDFNRVIELQPDHAEALTNRGIIYARMGRYQEALTDFDYAVELKPNGASIIGNRGATYYDMGRYEDALADCDRAIELQPNNLVAISLRAEVYALMENYSKALEDFNHAIRLNPDDVWLVAKRGRVYQLMEQYENALADFNYVIKQQSDLAEIIVLRGEVYLQTGQYEKALADFDRTIALEPDSIQISALLRGQVYLKIGRYTDAIDDFEHVLTRDPDNAGALAIRGITYLRMQRYPEALNALSQSLVLQPDLAWAIAERGETYLRLGRYAEALVDLDYAIKLEPNEDSYLFKRALVHYCLEQVDQMKGDLDGAIKIAEKIYSQDSQNWHNTFDLALYFLFAKKVEKAENLYKKALSDGASFYYVRMAICDLDGLMDLFPDYPYVHSIRDLLQDHVQNENIGK